VTATFPVAPGSVHSGVPPLAGADVGHALPADWVIGDAVASAADTVLADDFSASEPQAASVMASEALQATSTREEGTREKFTLATLQPHYAVLAGSPEPRAGHDGQMAPRDRDESGRPRNARPRDALGRLLPAGSEGVPRIPEDLALTPAQSLADAQDLLNRGLAFNAHEVLEGAWKNGPVGERPLWQGLAQLAVGITHVQRGNRGGAITLLRRGVGRLREVDRPAPYAVDIDGLIDWAAALIDGLAAHAEISPSALRPALVIQLL
jgi:predicted metal-dependent hydrolase